MQKDLIRIQKLHSSELLKNHGKQWHKLMSLDSKGRLYSSLEWIQIVQESEECEIYILVAFYNDELVAGMPINEISENESDHYNFISHLEKEIPLTPMPFDFTQSPSFKEHLNHIACFNRAGTSFDFRYAENFSSIEITEIFICFLEYIENHYQERSLAFMYTCQFPTYIEQILNERVFKKIIVGARYSLYSSGIEQYISSFSGKKKSAIKNEIAKMDKFGLSCHVRSHKDFINSFIPMVRENFLKHGFTRFSDDFYKKRSDAMSNFLKDDLFYLDLKVNNQSVAGACCILTGSILHIYHVGFFYEQIQKEWAAYFHLVFYQPLITVEKNLNRKITEIYTYEGADKLKLSRGSRPEYIYHYINLHNPTQEQLSYLDKVNLHSGLFHKELSQYPNA